MDLSGLYATVTVLPDSDGTYAAYAADGGELEMVAGPTDLERLKDIVAAGSDKPVMFLYADSDGSPQEAEWGSTEHGVPNIADQVA